MLHRDDPLSVTQTGINFIGDLRVNSGIGQAAMAMVDAALAAGVPVAYRELLAPFDDHDPLPSKYRLLPRKQVYSSNLLYYNAESLGAFSDRDIRLALHDTYTAAVWFWELAQMPARYEKLLKYIDEMWVASRFVRDAILSLDPEMPVEVIPVPVDLEVPERVSRAEFGIPEDRYVFLFTFAASSHGGRKNPFAVIDAFERAFGHSGDNGPILVIKAHHANHHAEFHAKLIAAMERVGGILIEEHLTRTQMNALLSCADAYVSLHRSEGFGLGMAESMFLGKPVIGTAYSGNLDFMTHENSYLVDYRLRPITMRDHYWFGEGFGQLYEPGMEWAYPDIEQAAAYMKHLYDHPNEGRARGAQASSDIRRSFSPTVVGEMVSQRLQHITQQGLTHKVYPVEGISESRGDGGPTDVAVFADQHRAAWYEWFKVRTAGEHTPVDRLPLAGPLMRILKRVVLLGRLSIQQSTLNIESLERIETLTTQVSQHSRKIRDLQARVGPADTNAHPSHQVQQYVESQIVRAEARAAVEHVALIERLNTVEQAVARLDVEARPRRGESGVTEQQLAIAELAFQVLATGDQNTPSLSVSELAKIARYVERAIPGTDQLTVIGVSNQVGPGDDHLVTITPPSGRRADDHSETNPGAIWYHFDLASHSQRLSQLTHTASNLPSDGYLVVVTSANRSDLAADSAIPLIFSGEPWESDRPVWVSVWQHAPGLVLEVARHQEGNKGNSGA